MVQQKNKKKKIVIISLSFFGLVIVYLGISLYFINRFYFGSSINCMNVSGKTVNEVNEQLDRKISNYVLTLYEKDGVKEKISGKDIALKHNSQKEIQRLKDEQNPFQWIKGLFSKKDNTFNEMISFDENLLKEKVDNLNCFDENNVVEPKEPRFVYTDNGYNLIKEVNGNKVNKDVLYKNVVNSIIKGETTIDLEKMNCYEKPKYSVKSKEVLDAKNTLNKYISSKITYNFEGNIEVLDAQEFNNWIKVDENFKVIIDEWRVNNYIEALSGKYDTYGATRNFVTSSGETRKISGGDYGWLINKSEEANQLVKAIKSGKVITRKPVYVQTAQGTLDNDIGNSYVEIDLTKQHLWFYKDGALIAEGPIVTGDLNSNHLTPSGVYKLNYKEKDAVLKSSTYAAPVSYWMPFNGDIGLHDASWRTEFGKDIYKSNGSHGCVNAPHELAEIIFSNIEVGTPVICY